MNGKRIATLLGAAALLASLHADALAQSSTSGAIQGSSKDENGSGLAGVTVVATSPILQGTRSTITDDGGQFTLSNLPVGEYQVVFYYADSQVTRSNVGIRLNKVTPVHVKFNTAVAGEKIIIEDSAPTIDPTSTNQGIIVGDDYTRNIPVPGRSFEAALEAAAGSSDDGLGVSFSGSTSLENSYVVDGVNTTGLTFGTLGSPVVQEFIKEIEVITGGYQAEYGRSTGAVVQAVTITGTNEFHGEVFTEFTNQFFQADSKRVFNSSSSIDAEADLKYDAFFGFQLGGPIIKDKLWFAVGFAPVIRRTDLVQINKRRSDCRVFDAQNNPSVPIDQPCTPQAIAADADTNPDIDPETGFFVFEELSRRRFAINTQFFNTLAKLNYSHSPEHQGQISFTGRPANQEGQNLGGDPTALAVTNSALIADVAVKWTSKFNNAKTELEVVGGLHTATSKTTAQNPRGNALPSERLRRVAGLNDADANLGVWSGLGHEDEATVRGCQDGGETDDYPDMINCPANLYVIGGIGNLSDDSEMRLSGQINVTQRLELAGNHEIKGGIDIEDNRINVPRQFSGNAVYDNFVGVQIRESRWVQIAGPMETDPRFNQTCGDNPNGEPLPDGSPAQYPCDFLEVGDEAAEVKGQTLNWAAYLRDSWQVLPNLTLNAGIRYEEQRLRYSEALQNTFDPLTNRDLGKNAMSLRNMWAPRLGIAYDWTKEGRSKIAGSWGRFYSSIPLRISDRAFGGETFLRRDFAAGACGPRNDNVGGPKGTDCLNDLDDPNDDATPIATNVFGTGVLVAPGVRPMHLDEFTLTAEYEVLEDLKVAVAYNNRRLGRVIEDVSTDNATTYIIANPGEFDTGEEEKLQAEIDALAEDDPLRAQRLSELEQFQKIRSFDKPRRDYQSIVISATKRFNRDLFVQGSYTYSKTEGNFPGLFSADTGQVDPNITSQYDLIELLANRDGPLPQDRPHALIVDGYYRWRVKNVGIFTPGVRFRASSGVPKNTLADHYLYGQNESFLLPRGERGRIGPSTSLDMSLSYARELSRGMEVSGYVQFFNLLNRQSPSTIDRAYTFDSANPVVGGEYKDLIWVKELDQNGLETPNPVSRNENYENTLGRFNPFNASIGARLTF